MNVWKIIAVRAAEQSSHATTIIRNAKSVASILKLSIKRKRPPSAATLDSQQVGNVFY